MEFLVEIDIRLPPSMPAEERDRWLGAERARGTELVRANTIRHIWRIPGRLSNVGVWSAADATELHEAIASLPLFRWMETEITALAAHPLSDELGGGNA